MPTPQDIARRQRQPTVDELPQELFESSDELPSDPTTDPNRLSFLDAKSPEWKEHVERWRTNMRRANGGDDVMDELWRFTWESYPGERVSRGRVPERYKQTVIDEESTELYPGEHFARRREAATYINLMDQYAAEIVGHLMREAPTPGTSLSFGTLGEVRRKEDIDLPTRAELIYYSTDGTGTDASQWDMFWSAAAQRAMHTGYRWIYCEAPTEAPGTQGREIKGFRPWLVEWGPDQVTNYAFHSDGLAWAIVKIPSRNPSVDPVSGEMLNNDDSEDYLLLVKAGVRSLGGAFSGGGWWRFNAKKELIGHQPWRGTMGEIPMAPLIFNRGKGTLGLPGTTELGNASVALMNISSAADHNCFDTAGAVKILTGIDAPGFNLFIQKWRKGNPIVPGLNKSDPTQRVSVEDGSANTAAGDTFAKRIAGIFETADRIKGQILTSGPSASGLAQQGGFMQGSVPRLALFASNIETCQNIMIAMIERRFGNPNPSGAAKWTRKYKLIELTTAGQSVLQLEAIAQIRSDTLDSLIIHGAATDEGFVPDTQTSTTIRNELLASAKDRQKMLEAGLLAKTTPGAPGARSRPMPPEPAQTNAPTPTQLDGPEVA